MSIRLKCPNASCQKALLIPDKLAGKKVKCPVCKTSVTVSAPVAAPANLEDFAAAAFSDDPVEKKAAVSGPAAPQKPQTIDFNCYYCDAELKLPAELGGKQEPCPECGRIIKVPALKVDKPKDWRDVEKKGPSFAKQDAPEKPVGAWDTTRGKVSEDALDEAGALPEEAEPRTLRDRLRLPLYIAAGVGLVALVWWVSSTFLLQSAQKRALSKALAYTQAADGKAKASPGVAAEVFRGAGEFAVRARKGKDANEYFGKARGEFLTEGKLDVLPLDRDLLLADLALSQVGLGGEGDDLLGKERLEWDDVLGEMQATLRAVRSPEVRVMAVRDTALKLRAAGRKAEAIGLAYGLKGGQPADKKANAEELSPLMAEAVAQLLAADQTSRAAELLPEPKGKDAMDAVTCVAYAEGRALQGNFDEARKLAERTWELDRVQAMLAVGAVALADGKADEAKLSAEAAQKAAADAAKRQKKVSPVLALQLSRLLARTGQTDEAKKVAGAITDKAVRARAHLELLKLELERLAKSGTAATLQTPDEYVKDKDTLSYALAHEAVARHNTRLGRRTEVLDAVEVMEERLRPLVQVGVALGIQDTEK